MMSKLETNFLTSEERLSLIRDHKLEKDGRKRDRMKFILLYNDGWSYAQIAKVLLLDDQTLRNYLKDYESGGMKSLLSFHYTGRPTILSEFECKELEAHLSDNTYLTSYQIRKYIKAKYKKEYSKKGIISLLHKMGFVYKKAKLVPGNPDELKQEEFVANYNKLSENLPEDEEILFLDGVHPTHNVRVAYGWIKAGVQKQVMSNTGRSRLNINGAYNPRSKEIIYRNEETINAKSTGMLILDILDKYPNAKKLHIIMDNAGYNRANFIKTFENHSRVNLIYLPPYCPNLNLIERLWKFLYKKVSVCRRYKKFVDFQNAILGFLDNIAQYKDELDTLMTENFNIIRHKNSNFILD
jgi:transposase